MVGKPTGNDIREKKMTLPLIHALTQSKNGESKKILKIVKKRIKSAENIEEVVNFVKANGGIEYAHQVMLDYRDKALNILADYPESDVKTALQQYIYYITDRNK